MDKVQDAYGVIAESSIQIQVSSFVACPLFLSQEMWGEHDNDQKNDV